MYFIIPTYYPWSSHKPRLTTLPPHLKNQKTKPQIKPKTHSASTKLQASIQFLKQFPILIYIYNIIILLYTILTMYIVRIVSRLSLKNFF